DAIAPQPVQARPEADRESTAALAHEQGLLLDIVMQARARPGNADGGADLARQGRDGRGEAHQPDLDLVMVDRVSIGADGLELADECVVARSARVPATTLEYAVELAAVEMRE